MLMSTQPNVLSLTMVSVSLFGNKYKAQGMAGMVFSLLGTHSNKELVAGTQRLLKIHCWYLSLRRW